MQSRVCFSWSVCGRKYPPAKAGWLVSGASSGLAHVRPFAFGSLFGFTGMLVAVPAAAAVGVLVRFALNSYLHSPMYDPAYHQSNPDAGPLIEAGENAGKEK